MEVSFPQSSAYLLNRHNGRLRISKNRPPPPCCGCCCRSYTSVICNSNYCEGTQQQCIHTLYSYIFSSHYYYHTNLDKNAMKKKELMTVNYRPQQLSRDIQAQIIVRLPATSILRLSPVCRDWYEMSHDSFTSRMLLHNNKPQLLAIHQGQEHDRVDLIQGNDVFRLKLLPKNTTIVGSSNGILCFLRHNEDNNAYVIGGGGDIYLYNPLLGSCSRGYLRMSLPKVPIEVDKRWCSLSFRYGYGFDCVRSEFKVVRFVVIGCPPLFFVQTSVVPMLANNSIGNPQPWKTIKAELNLKDEIFKDEPLSLVNGKLHCLARSFLGFKNKVISFDIASEEVLLLDDIFGFEEGNNILRIGEIGGRLFATTTRDFGNDYLDLWVMKDYGDPKSWEIQLSVRQVSISRQAQFMVPYQLFNKDGDELLLFSYSPHTYMVRHTPTLVSVPPHLARASQEYLY